jgi:4'-phosphopantetheinyl transferase
MCPAKGGIENMSRSCESSRAPSTTRWDFGKPENPIRVEFGQWDNSVSSRHMAASLGPDEVQVWSAGLDRGEAELLELARNLSPDERSRAERFRVEDARRQFIASRGLLRQLLASCVNTAASMVSFRYRPRGKPFLDPSTSNGDLSFNLSHSGRLLVIALTRGRKVGVDVEWFHGRTNCSLVADRIFSLRELSELHALPASKRREAFFNVWTRKEAYLKATGQGLTDDLQAIEVTLIPGQEPQLLKLPAGLESARQWGLEVIPLPPDFAGAVAFEKRPRGPD